MPRSPLTLKVLESCLDREGSLGEKTPTQLLLDLLPHHLVLHPVTLSLLQEHGSCSDQYKSQEVAASGGTLQGCVTPKQIPFPGCTLTLTPTLIHAPQPQV